MEGGDAGTGVPLILALHQLKILVMFKPSIDIKAARSISRLRDPIVRLHDKNDLEAVGEGVPAEWASVRFINPWVRSLDRLPRPGSFGAIGRALLGIRD